MHTHKPFNVFNLVASLGLSLLLAACANNASQALEINEGLFADEAFRSYISSNFDSDGDGSLSQSELEAVETLSFDGAAHINGLTIFPNLRSAQLAGPELVSAEIDAPALEVLDLANAPLLADLSISPNTKALTTVDISGTALEVADFSNAEALQALSVDEGLHVLLPASLVNDDGSSDVLVVVPAAAEGESAEEQSSEADNQDNTADYHIVAERYEFDIPEYWRGKVSWTITQTVNGDKVEVWKLGHEGQILLMWAEIQSGPETPAFGDIATSVINATASSGSQHVEFWRIRWEQWASMGMQNVFDVCNDEADLDELILLSTCGACAYNDIFQPGIDVIQVSIDADLVLNQTITDSYSGDAELGEIALGY